MKKKVRVAKIRTLSALFALIFALPVSWMGFTGLYTWLSPFIMLNSVLVLKSFVLLNAVAIVVLLLVIYKDRWFCRYLCPVGWGCDLVSEVKLRKSYFSKKLPDIGKWLVISSLAAAVMGIPLFILLDPMAIFNGFFSVFSGKLTLAAIISLSGLPIILAIHLIYPGIWCGKLCPLGGLQRLIRDIKILTYKLSGKNNSESVKSDSGRRLLIVSGLGLLAGLSIPKILKPAKTVNIRPPGSLPPDLFDTLCIRCGSCIKVCPTKILNHHTGTENMLAWMTPEVTFEKGYCLETCNLCSRVCPSGAINLFSIEAKNEIFMGTAEIHLKDCLLLNNTECDRCKTSCKYDALDIIPVEQSLLMKPAVIAEKCVGCGACAVICPVSVIGIRGFGI